MQSVAIAIAGALGALSRYGLGRAVGDRSFPWTTLAINLSGSLALGVLARLAAERHWSSTVTLAVTVGFLGAFTTFSTFSFETQMLVRAGRVRDAALYVGASIVGGVALAAVGYGLGGLTRS